MKFRVIMTVALLLLAASCAPLKNPDGTRTDAEKLLDQFPEKQAPEAEATILSDDDVLKTSLKEYGPAETIQRLIKITHAAGIDCHNRAHQTGRTSYELFGNNVFKLVLPECHSGFYHGAIEAFFRKNGTASLKENLSTICIEGLNGFFAHQCLHGIGHGLMAWADYDLPGSLEYCNLLPESTGRSSCRTGVFMENIVGSLDDSPEAKKRGHVAKYISDDPQYPCRIVKEEYKNDCYFLQTDRMRALSKTGFEGVARACEQAPAAYQQSCFGSMGRTIGGQFRGNPAGAIKHCEFAKENVNRIECILGAGQDTFWDRNGMQLAADYCTLVPADEGQDQCYAVIIRRSLEVLTPQLRETFCNLLPGRWTSDCLSSKP